MKINQLCDELKKVAGTGNFTLPNSIVTAVNVSDFLSNVLKTDRVDLTSAKVSCDQSTVTLTADLILFGKNFTLTWSFTQENGDSITWDFEASTSETSQVVRVTRHFLSELPDMPSTISNLGLTRISLKASLNKTTGNYGLVLDAQSSWGEVTMAVVDNDGTWGAALGVAVSDSFNLSKIARGLTDFNSLSFSDSVVIISDFTDSSIKIAGINGVVKGIYFQSTLTIKSNHSSSQLLILINELSKSLDGVPIQCSIDLSGNDFTLTAGIDKSFSLPGFSKLKLSNMQLSIDTTPSISLSGELTIPVKIPADPSVDSLTVTGAISFVYSDGTGTIEATLSSDTIITDPFEIKGITLKEVGVGLDVEFGVETGVGITLEGDFQLGKSKQFDDKFAITLDFDDDLPNPSLLYVSDTNLSLPVIFDALIGGSIKLPNELTGFSFKKLVLYWADRAQTLPDGTPAQVGFGFNAAIDFWGFNTYAALMVKQNSGISGQASMDPINLLDGKIKITGSGKGGFGVTAGGAYFDFNTASETFNASLDAYILGLSETVNASISSSSLSIKINTNLGFMSDSVDVAFKNCLDMSFSSTLHIGINCKPTIKLDHYTLGTIHVDADMIGSLDVSVNGTNFTARVDASFSWNGNSFGFNYDVSADLTELADLAGAIEKKLVAEAEAIFSDWFSKVDNYIDAVVKGLLTDGDFAVNVLYHVYDHSISKLIKTLATFPSYHMNGKIDFHADVSQGIPSESFHADLGHPIDYHASWHEDFLHSFHLDKHADVDASRNFSTPAFKVTLLDIKPDQHFDMMVPPKVHADATSPYVDVSKHLDADFVGGEFSVSGETGINSKVGLNDIDLTAKLNIIAHAGGHADISVAHIGLSKHGDTGKIHIDKSV